MMTINHHRNRNIPDALWIAYLRLKIRVLGDRIKCMHGIRFRDDCPYCPEEAAELTKLSEEMGLYD